MPEKRKLPPPPEQKPSAMANILGGIQSLLGRVGIGPQSDVDPVDLWLNPVAYSRITRTPIYQASGLGWPSAQGGEYKPEAGAIRILPSQLGDPWSGGALVAHESAHDIFQRAGLAPAARDLLNAVDLSSRVKDAIYGAPALYPNPDANDVQMANEGLAYSVNLPSGSPYVNYVASQIKDPVLAKQLLRLHDNRVGSLFGEAWPKPSRPKK